MQEGFLLSGKFVARVQQPFWFTRKVITRVHGTFWSSGKVIARVRQAFRKMNDINFSIHSFPSQIYDFR
ncbi:hypothetical protein [Chryseobacterium sp. POE27]|uniref:hypothetical protein n=1 Tax=Chryseobacterium sp. POE27 TaxID=3138177 RepID=UPI003219BBD0